MSISEKLLKEAAADAATDWTVGMVAVLSGVGYFWIILGLLLVGQDDDPWPWIAAGAASLLAGAIWRLGAERRE